MSRLTFAPKFNWAVRAWVAAAMLMLAGATTQGADAAELKALCRRPEPVLCYEVEVCPACAWHHLMRKYPAGGRTPRQKKATPAP